MATEAKWTEAYDVTIDEVAYLVDLLNADSWLENDQETLLAMDEVLE